jgi:hypothetical protein
MNKHKVVPQARLKNMAWLGLLILFFLAPAKAQCADEFGSMYITDSLVHFIKPANNRREHSVIIVPGLNLSSYIFVTTPDGRTGWAQMLPCCLRPMVVWERSSHCQMT